MSHSVLIVEDHPEMQELYQRTFSRAEFERIEIAWNGAQALEMMAQHCPDLVVLDLDMPVLSGLDVIRSMKAAPLSCPARIIVATANAEFSCSVEADLADLFLLKPVRMNDLITMARRLLGIQTPVS